MSYKKNVKIDQVKDSILIGGIDIGSTLQYRLKIRLFHRRV